MESMEWQRLKYKLLSNDKKAFRALLFCVVAFVEVSLANEISDASHPFCLKIGEMKAN
jgi:hypothetical protein